jgi:hypothetical protein
MPFERPLSYHYHHQSSVRHGTLQARRTTGAANHELCRHTDAVTLQALRTAGAAAALSIQTYGDWLQRTIPTLSNNASVGEGAYLWYQTHVAMTNTSAGQIADFGASEFVRAQAALAIEKHRNDMAGLPPLPLLASLQAQEAATLAAQAEIKAYATVQRLFTVPEWLPNYTVAAIPAWLAPFDYSQLGEEDDFTTPAESIGGMDFTRYVPPPVEGLPFFLDAMARDPRSVIVHEGLPGHWMQFSVSWRNMRESRKRWIDSVANEGLARCAFSPWILLC